MIRPRLQVNLKTFQRKWRIDSANVRKYLRKVWMEICNAGIQPERIRNVVRTTRPQKQSLRTVVTGGRVARTTAEVTIVFLNDQQIRRYNNDYRKKDYPTDVLSFPVNELQDEVLKGTRRQIFYLGDILISMERAALQAREKSHTIQRELRVLLLHGMLHLLGFDHEVDNGQMERLERKLRRAVL